MRSTEPFPETIRRLLEAEKISERELTKRAGRHGFVRNNSTLHRLFTGQNRARPEHMEAIAAALNVPPETFAEYRLWQARSGYDPEVVGWDKAIRNLRHLEGDTDQADEPLPAAEVAERLAGEDDREARAGSS